MPHRRPVMLDDLDALTMPYWDAMPKTRVLLRDPGRTFTNHFSPAPLSASSRAAILTGQYGHNNHVLTNKGPWGGYPAFLTNGDGDRTFAKYLQDAGYRTMRAGKYIPGYELFAVDDQRVPSVARIIKVDSTTP